MRKRVGVGIVMLVLLVDRPNQAEAGAFATEITHKVPVEALRARLEDHVIRWLPEGATIPIEAP